MNIVLKLETKERQQLAEKYKSYEQVSKNPYITFFAKVGKTSISVYTSGKLFFKETRLKISE